MESPPERVKSEQSCSLKVKTIGVSMSKGVQVDQSFVVDRDVNIINNYLVYNNIIIAGN